jgi:tetratricopeptide (TPR) repeat protein
VHAAHRFLRDYPDGQLYADLHGYTAGQSPTEPGEVLEVFLKRLGVSAEETPATIEDRSGLLRQLLASRRVLMVLDNAATEEQVRPLMPGAGGSLVLVTSRSVLAGLEVDERIDLDVLAGVEATALLAELIGPERAAAAPQAVAQVAEWCGRLPLALRIAGQLLASRPAWPVAKLAQMLAGERDRLAQLKAGDLQVRAALEVSYAQLADDDARLFRLLGLHPGPDFDVAAAASLAGIEQEAAVQVLDRLATVHLVIEDASGRFGMHDLLRLFARSTCQETDDQASRDAAEARLVRHYTDLADALGSCIDPRLRTAAEQEGMRLPSIREALALFEAERPNLLATLGLASQRGWNEQVVQFSASMGNPLELLHHLDDRLTIAEAQLAAARRAKDTPAEGPALGNLGEAYRGLGRFEEAIGCFQDALAIFRETGDRNSVAMTLNNLGLAYQALQRFEEAIGCLQDALPIRQEVGDQRGEGRTLNNLGIVYKDLRRFEEAIGCYQQDIAICRETGDRYGEGQTFGNLGAAYQELQRFDEAIGCYQDALAIFREVGYRYGEGSILVGLGNVYQQLRQSVRAAACWQDAAAVLRDAGGHEVAELLEQQAANARSRRRRWRRRS